MAEFFGSITSDPQSLSLLKWWAGTVGAALFASSKRLTRELDPSALVEDDYERI